jgi:hypothetical protein
MAGILTQRYCGVKRWWSLSSEVLSLIWGCDVKSHCSNKAGLKSNHFHILGEGKDPAFVEPYLDHADSLPVGVEPSAPMELLAHIFYNFLQAQKG